MGHVVQLSHQAEGATPPATAGQEPSDAIKGTPALFDLPLWADILFGLSLLANLYGGLLTWRHRTLKKQSVQEQ
jgi:nickel transport protein